MKYQKLRDFYNIHLFGLSLLSNVRRGDCVLEIGCGSESLIVKSGLIHRAKVTGVDIYEPYVREHLKEGVYHNCICGDVTRMDFAPLSFDVVVCMDVIEHLHKPDGHRLLRQMKTWARRQVIITVPNGHVDNDLSDGNGHQSHLSAWSAIELADEGYIVRGLSGWKGLRKEKAELRYTNPYLFWAGVSLLSQAAVYWLPSQAYHLLALREK